LQAALPSLLKPGGELLFGSPPFCFLYSDFLPVCKCLFLLQKILTVLRISYIALSDSIDSGFWGSKKGPGQGREGEEGRNAACAPAATAARF
jgi:hypothetical protein